MKLQNLSTAKHTTINLHNREMPVLIDGTGDLACLCVGIGSLLQRTLSKEFKERFTVYSTDAYWVKQETPPGLNDITMESICQDIIKIAKQLNLENYYLAGHSVYGGIVAEVAKYQPPGLAGVIGIGATPGWNDDIINFKNQYFEQHASTRRKLRFAELQAGYNKDKLPTDSLVSVNAYYAESAKYFAQDVSMHDMQTLWNGIHCDDAVMNHLFNTVLPKYNFAENVDCIKVPLIVAGGQKDFDSTPLEIWKKYPQPEQFTLLDCGPVGHWPHWEAAQTFDAGVNNWIDK